VFISQKKKAMKDSIASQKANYMAECESDGARELDIQVEVLL
jgi:hypothetical protein